MANFNVVGFDEMEKEILRQSEKAKHIAPKMLKAGADILIKAQKSELKRIIKTNKSIGTLEKSIGAGNVKKTDTCYYLDVYPQGNQPHGSPGNGGRNTGKKRKNGNAKKVSNAQVGFTLEYGSSVLPAQPWMSVANEKSADSVHKAMQEVWDNEQE